MKVINKSRKIIGINGNPLLPGAYMALADGAEKHPTIVDYLKKGILADVDNPIAAIDKNGISVAEKAHIAEEDLAAVKAEKEAEIKAVQSMKKPELLKKAAGMGLEAKDDDTVDVLKEKIIGAINSKE